MYKTGCDPERLRDVLWNLSKLSPPESGSDHDPEDYVIQQDYFVPRKERGESLPLANSPSAEETEQLPGKQLPPTDYISASLVVR